MRTIICHYHIFKNSGTSFDALLTENYGDRHLCFDGPFPFFTIDQEQLSRIIERNIDAVAFSSHQIQLPVPTSLDFFVLPVLFIRHPLLRIYSIYNYKKKVDDGTPISESAKAMEFNDWIRLCFSDRKHIVHISNAQTRFVSAVYRQRPLMRRNSYGMEYDLHQAVRNINGVQLLARTEYFDQDVARFQGILKEYGINFKYKKMEPKNVTSRNHHKSVDERLHEIKSSVSKEQYQALLKANDQDLFLFRYVSELIS